MDYQKIKIEFHNHINIVNNLNQSMYNFDTFSQICVFLNDKEKIYLTTTCTSTNIFKYKIIYTDCVSWQRCHNLPFYDNFESITTENMQVSFPKNIKKILLCEDGTDKPGRMGRCKLNALGISRWPLSFPIAAAERLSVKIPSTVTHLTLCQRFAENIILSIPKSVTHIDFCWSCNSPIEKYITLSSVTHLTLQRRFNGLIKDRIPQSVTHLKFGEYFDQSIKGCIPNSVTYLKFGTLFNKSIKNSIPNSVTHLKFGKYFNRSIKNSIPALVTHLTLSYFFNNFETTLPYTITHLKIGNEKKYHEKNIRMINGNYTYADDDHFNNIKKYIPPSVIDLLLVIEENDMDNVD